MREKKQCKGCGRTYSPFFGPDSAFHTMAHSFCLTCINRGPALPDSLAEYHLLGEEARRIQDTPEYTAKLAGKQRLHS